MKKSLVITSIAPATFPALQTYAKEASVNGYDFIVIGDTKSPDVFQLDGCDFWDIKRQLQSGFSFAQNCPTKHYARKNIGYLIAIQNGTKEILETDDDNLPRPEFWTYPRERNVEALDVNNQGWVNVYHYFSDKFIWPRGIPLQELHKKLPSADTFATKNLLCPIQQGLADENPDVDAVYRLTYPLPLDFNKGAAKMALGNQAWCPFNSQNTYWFEEAFGLLYLPAYCSFRMTDIWRSFVAQRIAWENNWSVLFHESTVWQERNEHDLMKDFEDEIPGYLYNAKIANALSDLSLKAGKENILDNLIKCYDTLIDNKWVGKEEGALVRNWADDLSKIS